MARTLPDHWFYAAPPVEESGLHAFRREEARHASKALRLRVGDGIQWIDGVGGRYEGIVRAMGREGMTAQVTHHRQDEIGRALHLYVGQLHDATRLEWLVEKATELGVTGITLLATARVQRTRYRLERLGAKALAATKQSGRAFLPMIRELDFSAAVLDERGSMPPDLAAFAKTGNGAVGPIRQRLIAHCYADQPRTPLTSLDLADGDVELFIGPEGDFTVEEVVLAQAQNCLPVSLGEARLRTETAAVAALAVLSIR